MTDYILHHLGPFDVPGHRPRRVRVYVPPRDRHATSPVLYMFDGQNCFDDEPSYAGGWHLHRTARSLWKKHGHAPVVVGIDHGGDARIDELSPFRDGRTDALLDWLVGALIPRVREEFRLEDRPDRAAIGGSSLGGIAALYAHFRHPDRFGMAMAMSPSLWVGNGRIFTWLHERPRPLASRIYLDAGKLEAGGRMLGATRRLAEELRGRGWDDRSLRYVEAARGKHSEKDWRRRAPGAIAWLFGWARR
jgi:enterochelin esterase-like enzyme